MAKNAGVWGIDIGQAAFKALRCTLQDGEVVADAFDYIEYPKILSQPEAEPEKMIRDAIDQFLSRNDVNSYRIALAVPGQSGLAKFFKPPPVDAKLIPEIVKFEGAPTDPLCAGRRHLGFPADGWRRGRRLCAGNGSRLVRDETRAGLSRDEAVSGCGRRAGHHPAGAAEHLQLRGVRHSARRRAGRGIRSGESAHRRSSCSRWVPTRPTW